MAKKNDQAQSPARKKQRWYHNFIDAYKVVKRTYTWVGIAMIVIPVVLIALGILAVIFWRMGVFWLITAIALALLIDLSLLAYLVRPAMYRQVDGRPGAVYAVLSQIRRGWVVEEEPVAVNKSQDLVWQIVGRPGIVLISEGPSSRVLPMLHNERKRITRAITNVPVIYIQSGHDEGQVPLPKLDAALRRQKKVLTKHEVPAVANRLQAIGSRGVAVPKGVDPYKVQRQGSRRALRGQ